MPAGVGALYYKECDSTNKVAAEFASNSHKGPVWITAGSQTGGRGRKGRSWSSPKGNLFTSLLFAPDLRISDLGPLPYIVGLAIRDAMIAAGASPQSVQCKWPNDVLIEQKKAAGVLIESGAKAGGGIDYLIIGIGVNLQFHPKDSAFPATDLKNETGREYSPKEFLVALAATLKKRLDDWNLADFSTIKDEWTAAAWGIGDTRTINTATESFEATLIGLDDQGGLIVRLPDGDDRTIITADIFPAESNE